MPDAVSMFRPLVAVSLLALAACRASTPPPDAVPTDAASSPSASAADAGGDPETGASPIQPTSDGGSCACEATGWFLPDHRDACTACLAQKCANEAASCNEVCCISPSVDDTCSNGGIAPYRECMARACADACPSCESNPALPCGGASTGTTCIDPVQPAGVPYSVSCSVPSARGDLRDYCCAPWSGARVCIAGGIATAGCAAGEFPFNCLTGRSPTEADPSLKCGAPIPDAAGDGVDFCCTR